MTFHSTLDTDMWHASFQMLDRALERLALLDQRAATAFGMKMDGIEMVKLENIVGLEFRAIPSRQMVELIQEVNSKLGEFYQ